MRSASQAGHAHIADDLALPQTLPLAEATGKARQVAVYRGEVALMINHHHVAVAALFADEGDDAVAGDLDLGAHRRGVIDPFMRAPFVQHRMEARLAETGTDARELDRRAQEGLVHALALRRVVVAGVFGG